jgi:hypothetical protein
VGDYRVNNRGQLKVNKIIREGDSAKGWLTKKELSPGFGRKIGAEFFLFFPHSVRTPF